MGILNGEFKLGWIFCIGILNGDFEWDFEKGF